MKILSLLVGLDGDRPSLDSIHSTIFQRIYHRLLRVRQIQQNEGISLTIEDPEPAAAAETGQIKALFLIGDGDLSGLGVGIPASRGPKASHELKLTRDSGAHQFSDVTGAPVEQAGDLPGFLGAEGTGVRRGKEEKGPNGIEGFPEEYDK